MVADVAIHGESTDEDARQLNWDYNISLATSQLQDETGVYITVPPIPRPEDGVSTEEMALTWQNILSEQK